MSDEPTEINSETTAPEAPAPEVPAFEAVTEQEPVGRFSEADLAKARQQEKDKLYPQLQKMQEELGSLRAERDERAAREEAERRAADEAARRKAEEEMDVRQLLTAKEQEWQQQLEAERLERERAFALLEQERRVAQLQQYRQMRIEQERDDIFPELIDLVSGETTEEIEQSITGLKERTARILSAAQQASASVRKDMTGARVTAPPAGPLDTELQNKTFTPEQIRSMSAKDYEKYRSQLIGSDGRGQGLFG